MVRHTPLSFNAPHPSSYPCTDDRGLFLWNKLTDSLYWCPAADPGCKQGPPVPCGKNNNGANCYCDFDVEGNKFCVGTHEYCDNILCTSSSQCSVGHRCVANCCNNKQPTCQPRCQNIQLPTTEEEREEGIVDPGDRNLPYFL